MCPSLGWGSARANLKFLPQILIKLATMTHNIDQILYICDVCSEIIGFAINSDNLPYIKEKDLCKCISF
jgi:hypothetical protein